MVPAYNAHVDYIVTLLDSGTDDTVDNDLHAVLLKTRAINITSAGQAVSAVDIGLSAPRDTVSYALSEASRNLFKHSSISNAWTLVGDTGRSSIEAIAYDPIHEVLYATDTNQLGSVNGTTALFIAIGSPMGSIDGSLGPYDVQDVDSLSYDPGLDVLWGVDHRSGGDILFQIDRTTGEPIEDGFG